MKTTATSLMLAVALVGCGAGAYPGGRIWLTNPTAIAQTSGLVAEVLSHGPTSHEPTPEETRAVTATGSIRFERVLGNHAMFHQATIRFTPDGRTLVSVGPGGDLRVWDTVSRSMKGTYPACTQGFCETTEVSVSGDGRLLAHGNSCGEICVREVATGRVVRAWPAHRERVWALAFAPSGDLLSYGYQPKVVAEGKLRSEIVQEEQGGDLKHWRVGVETPVAAVRIGPLGGFRIANAIRISKDARLIAVARPNHVLQGLDTGGRLLWTVEQAYTQAFAFAEHDNQLVVVESERLYVLDSLTGRKLRDFKAQSPVRARPGVVGGGLLPWSSCLQVTHDGRAITALEDDPFLFMWDVAHGREVDHPVARGYPICGGTLSPDGTLLVGAQGEQLALWDTALGLPLPDGGIEHLSLSLDGHWAATTGADRVVRIWVVKSGSVRQWRTDSAIATSLSADGDRMLVNFRLDEGSTTLLDSHTGRIVWSWRGRSPMAASVLSPDGRRVATASLTEGISFHDLGNGRRLWGLAANDYQDTVMAFSPDARFLIHQDRDHVLSIRGAENGQVIQRLGDPQNLSGVLWSPDGKFVVARAVGLDVYELRTGRKIREYPYPGAPFALASGGLIIRALGPDRTTVRIEGLTDGVPLDSITLGERFRGVSSLAVTSDGSRLLLGTGSGVVLTFAR